MDIALWGAEHELSGVVEVEGKGIFPSNDVCDAVSKFSQILVAYRLCLLVKILLLYGRMRPLPAAITRPVHGMVIIALCSR